MSNQAHISAAIEKLERLKAESTPGIWGRINGYLHSTEFFPATEHCEARTEETDLTGGGDEVGGYLYSTIDADLIVTLHRTIDAQLSLLRLALEYGDLDVGNGSRFVKRAQELADAILGEGEE